MRNALTAILTDGNVPADLEVTYDDRHGLWGGTRIFISGRGSGHEHRARVGEDPTPEVIKTEIAEGELLELVRLLVELDAWEQRATERTPVPDEGRATLHISIGGQACRVWERTHELARSRRLVLIRDKMSEIVRAGRAA